LVLVIMDQFTRRIIGFGIHRGTVDGPSLCSMFQRAIQGQALPKYLSMDNDPLYRFYQWQARLRVLEVLEIKTIPHVPLSHPFVERLVGTLTKERVPGSSIILDNRRPGGEAARVSEVFQ
jgi:putative transposase